MSSQPLNQQTNGSPLLLFLLVVCLLAIVIQVNIIARLPQERALTQDSWEYLAIAHNVITSAGYSYDGISPTRMRPPVYPLFLAAVGKLPTSELARTEIPGLNRWTRTEERLSLLESIEGFTLLVRTFQVIFNTLTVLLTFCVGAILLRPTAGALASLLVACYIPLQASSASILNESLYTLILMTFVWLLALAQSRKRPACWLAAGTALGLLTLCRMTTLLLPAFLVPLYLWRRSSPVSEERVTSGAAGSVLLLLGFTALLFPWAMRNQVALGHFTPVTSESVDLWMGTYPSMAVQRRILDELSPPPDVPPFPQITSRHHYKSEEANRLFRTEASKNVLADPIGLLLRAPQKVCLVWSYFPRIGPLYFRYLSPPVRNLLRCLHWLTLALALWGLFILRQRWRELAPLWLPLLCLDFVLSLVALADRYLVPFMPLVLILAAAGMLGVFTRRPGSFAPSPTRVRTAP